jgi:hypothetical protein
VAPIPILDLPSQLGLPLLLQQPFHARRLLALALELLLCHLRAAAHTKGKSTACGFGRRTGMRMQGGGGGGGGGGGP